MPELDAGGTRISGSVVLVTGGTGSFGSVMAQKLLQSGVGEVRIFSRDEAKQDHMRRSFSDERLRFYVGDVREATSLDEVMAGVDFVFHAAALKQVPSCEFFPLEAVRTNVIGSSNVITAAHRSGVRTLVCLSTDKAVYPINAMGMSKALMEKAAQAFARNHPESVTTVCITRYGNVMCSRGSVIPLFVSQLKSDKPVTLTEPKMTRFMMSLTDSVHLVEHAFLNADPGDVFVPRAPACTVETLIGALGNVLGITPKVHVIGIRHGEKWHETLATAEELSRSVEQDGYIRIRLDTRDLNYAPFFDEGDPTIEGIEDYGSDSARQLDIGEMEQLLRSLPEIQAEIDGQSAG